MAGPLVKPRGDIPGETNMTTEFSILAWSILLGFVHLFAGSGAIAVKNGMKWAAGPRDEQPEPTKLAARLQRANRNFLETFPYFAVAVLIVHALGRENATTALGSEIYLVGRVLYLPLYAVGTPLVRTLVWGASLVGIFMVLSALA